MSKPSGAARVLSQASARNRWLEAQNLHVPALFGAGPEATRLAIEHLGYVQIDTIHVIERCHHHILHTRIPDYRREHLHHAQTIGKTVFEYWTHALSYVPVRDLKFFVADMKRHRLAPKSWFSPVTPADLARILDLVERGGALSIRDIDDDVLVEKDHAWASRKPSKRALQLAFFNGALAVSERKGMLKTYEVMHRHFGWDKPPKPATGKQHLDYLLDRALRTQAVVSVDSICHLDPGRKVAIRQLIEARVKRRKLQAVQIEGAGRQLHWAEPQTLDCPAVAASDLVHILSPFDPLVIQRERLKSFFNYGHRFEAYLPKEKRVMGYFAVPILLGNEIIAAIDLKADRQKQALQVQQWSWVGKGEAGEHKVVVEEALHRFGRFQLG